MVPSFLSTMNKKHFTNITSLIVVMMSLLLLSCGGDDEKSDPQDNNKNETQTDPQTDTNNEESSAVGILTVNGVDYEMPYLYWFCNDYYESEGSYYYHLEYYAWDRGKSSSYPADLKYKLFYITFRKEGGAQFPPTGEFSPSSYSVTVNNFYGHCKSSPLSITKDGDIYEIKMEEDQIYGDPSESTYKFYYKGKIKTKVPGK